MGTRQIGQRGAILVGLGAMVGAGIFSSIAPAAKVHGGWLFLSLLLAAAVAFLNAKSVARLAVVHPESGGAYTYGRRRLSRAAGVAAGVAFIAGKSASASAMALTFAAYVAPAHSKTVALLVLVGLTAVNYVGIKKTIALTAVFLVPVFAALGTAVFAALAGEPRFDRLSFSTAVPPDSGAVLSSAALLFFAFAGYARIATLAGEVQAPEKTIPRAISVAFLITLAVYLAVFVAVIAALDPAILATSQAPLADAASSSPSLQLAVRAGAAIACLNVLLSLIAGISRTLSSMAAPENADAPRFFAAVHPRFDVPHRAVVAAGILAAIIVSVGDVVRSIALSSFCVLLYYAVANAAALSLPREKRGPAVYPVLGLGGCLAIASSLVWFGA